MNRRSIFALSAIAALGLALLPSSIVAQQGTLKQQLTGTWTFVSCEVPANATRQPVCVNPNGILILDASGRYAQVQAARGRPQPTTTGPQNRVDVAPDYYKAIAQGVVANFGTWSVNEVDRTMTRKTEGALFPNAEGVETKFSVSLTGDEVKFGVANNPTGGATVWRRAK
jgi:hypothetical protein